MDVPAPITDVRKIKQLRQLHGMSQAALAAVLGLPRETVNRIERGARVLTLRQASHIALVFATLDKKEPEAKPAKSAKSPNYNPRSSYNFATLDQRHLKLEQVDSLPVGTHYLFQQDLKGWRTRVRGTGSRWDDATVQAGAELSHAAWVDATAKRLGTE